MLSRLAVFLSGCFWYPEAVYSARLYFLSYLCAELNKSVYKPEGFGREQRQNPTQPESESDGGCRHSPSRPLPCSAGRASPL